MGRRVSGVCRRLLPDLDGPVVRWSVGPLGPQTEAPAVGGPARLHSARAVRRAGPVRARLHGAKEGRAAVFGEPVGRH